jgi:hypothetical protein
MNPFSRYIENMCNRQLKVKEPVHSNKTMGIKKGLIAKKIESEQKSVIRW